MSLNRGLSTGWFGVPGLTPRRHATVHVAVDGHPLCGVRFDHRAEYQICAKGAYLSYVTCKRCRQKVEAAELCYSPARETQR